MKRTLTVQLAETAIDKRDSRESLGELLEQVLDVLHPKGNTDSWPDARWIARSAIRAVCEEIIRTGYAWTPMEVSFTNLWRERAKGFRFQASKN